MNFKYLAIALVASAGFAGSASAAQISGSIGFSGIGSTWAFDGTDGFTLSPLTDNIAVDTVSGDFNQAGSTVGSVGTMYGVNVNNLPVAPQWTMGIFSFELTAAQIDFIRSTSLPYSLVMSGSGYATAANYDRTFGTWTWTGSSTDGVSFTFAPTTAVTPRLPEPGTLALLGLGLVGLGMSRRRKA